MEERIFYVLYAWRERLNKNELLRCIKTDTFSALADSKSFSKGLIATYPQVAVLFKDEVFVDFLGLPAKHSEKRLKTGILDHMKDFILELGKEDMIFIDKEYALNVGGKVFKIDLLFFHRVLQCLVGVELKANDFKPKDNSNFILRHWTET
jgi:predicted nuclease of restriction endonuclease-like (RecB) superfamily